jgi:hypothetical protein
VSNNTTLNPGVGGDIIIDEDIGGVKMPVSKIRLGATGVDGGDVTTANPFPVRQSDGTNQSTIKAASTAAAATDTALVVAVSPNNTVPVSIAGTVAISAASLPALSGTSAVSGTVTANQGTPNSTANAWPIKNTDGTNVAAVKAASTAAAATDPALVVAVSPNANLATQVAQASTTAGQSGPLAQASVTRFYTAYTPGQTDPLAMNAGGALRVSPMHEIDAGAVTGTPWLLAPEISEDFRTRAELDSWLDEEVFCYGAQNTGKHTIDTTTMTVSYLTSGFVTNASGITTINTGVGFSTRRFFPVGSSQTILVYFKIAFSSALGTNTTVDWGLFQRPTSTPYAPTDGVYLRATSAGVFGVMNSGGTETLTSAFTVSSGGATWVPSGGTEYDVIVQTQPSISVFWVDLRDGNGYTRMATLSSDSTSRPRPFQSGSCPVSIRHAIGGTVASAGTTFRVVEYGVNLGGQAWNMSVAEQQGLAGHSGAQGQAGNTMGSTAAFTNSQAPGAGAAMTNTTAALGTGLGGQFSALPTLAANTDGIICSFQNPAGSATVTGRTLVIDSIKIDAIVTTALVGGPLAYVYSAAWGHTAVSLATAEAANAKAPRRKYLGMHAFPATAAALTVPTAAIPILPQTDMIVQPGEFFAICGKNLGTVTTSGVVTFLIAINSHWAI